MKGIKNEKTNLFTIPVPLPLGEGAKEEVNA